MKTIISTIAIGLIILFSASCRRDTETTQDFEAIDSPVPIYDKDFHTTLPSGLSIDAYALEGPPSTEPLVFDPVSDYQQEQILAIHEEDRKLQYAENTFFNEIGFGMTAEINDRILVAREIYTTSHKTKPDSPASAAIEVVLGDDVVFTADAGVASPLTHLQGLWSYKEDWVLEYAHATITFNETENTTKSEAVGHLVKNGVLLNEQYGFDEIFGFQLLKRKPFYFSKKNGKIGISYNDQVTMLGYEEIPHYGCCGAGMLNPSRAKNMVSIFALKENTW